MTVGWGLKGRFITSSPTVPQIARTVSGSPSRGGSKFSLFASTAHSTVADGRFLKLIESRREEKANSRAFPAGELARHGRY